MNRKKFPQHLRNLLSTYKPSLESPTQELKTAESSLSCLSIILLGEMARVSLPASHSSTYLANVINDVFEIIYFIDGQINNIGNFDCKLKSMTAKVLWKGKATSFVIDGQSKSVNKGLVLSHQSDLNLALGAIEDFHKSFVEQANNNINTPGEDSVNLCITTPMVEDYAAPVVEEASEIQGFRQDENV
ncbi:hypothetical protein FRX31_003298 [Thalictrum thalictroides]|uniref:Uncharacterized protein n=1 Tax=Thalictrum thalictroides TaxID=46969 RepID=A0A7J6XFA7_THATH|nr:hypothetical protein FRX31_003298 [Thalictrum thalictroides]